MLVPTQDNLTQNMNALPQTQVSNPLTPERGAMYGTELKRQYDEQNKAQRELADIQVQNAIYANELRVDDSVNQLDQYISRKTYDKNEGFTNIKGVSAFERESKKPLADEYVDNARAEVARIAEGLGNPAQRQAFIAKADAKLTQFYNNLTRHEGQEFQSYSVSVREGTIKNAVDRIGRNYKDPSVINEAMVSIRSSAADLARLTGKSPEETEAAIREAASNGHLVAVQAALQADDPKFADDYLKKHASDMTADDILRANGVVTEQLNSKLASDVATNVMREAVPSIKTSDIDRAFNVAIGKESNWQQFDKNGAPLRSPEGATGVAQVMPGTGPEAAKLAGLPWDEEKFKNDKDYNYAIGKAYFIKQLQDFGGNISKAYAAYNAGPRWVKEAQARAAAAEPGTQQADWFWQLNNDGRARAKQLETEDYVKTNVSKYAAGGGMNQRPSLYDLQQRVREQVGTDNPKRLKMALDEVARQYDSMTKAIKQNEEAATADAMRYVMVNGGSFTSLPPQLRAAIPPQDVGKVMDFASKWAKGDDSTNYVVYNKLASDPAYLASLSDNQFMALRSELSETDFKHFATQRGASATKVGDLNQAGIKNIVDTQLLSSGVDPTPDMKKAKEVARIGALRKFINDAVIAEQARLGKQMSEAELTKYISGLFAVSAPIDSFWNKEGPMLRMQDASYIPESIRGRLKEAFKARGVPNPSDADLMGAYWRGRITPVSKKEEK